MKFQWLVKFRWLVKFQWPVLIIALLHFFSFSAASGSEQIVIEVHESVHVNSRKVRLGEISDIEAPDLLKRQLAAIDAGFAPVPGKIKIIDGRRLESKIKSNRLFYANGISFDDVALIMPEKIYVERASQQISEDDLKAIYEEYVHEHSDGKEFEIRDFSVRGLDIYPEGEISLSPPLSNNRGLKGRVTLYVNIQVNRKDYGRLSLSGWIDVFDYVLCASRSLTRGKTVEPGDVTVQRISIGSVHGDYFSVEQDVIGKVLTRNAQSGKAITPNMIEDPALIQKGDTVKIVAARANLRIVTLGIVKSDGRMDDTVQVQNMTSGKIINAVVTGKNSVKVFY
ncbi:MAG: flagellar basal body P-ring formation protein FlgA [Desulfamplus sp.]|nr:flagellar basal body P-ring formation protein FlgA [Desulfamplus sp.]